MRMVIKLDWLEVRNVNLEMAGKKSTLGLIGGDRLRWTLSPMYTRKINFLLDCWLAVRTKEDVVFVLWLLKSITVINQSQME